MEFEIRDYNSMDDYTLFLMMLSANVSLEEKKFIVTNCSSRLNAMKENTFLQMMRQFEMQDVLGISDYICDKVKSFNRKQLEKTLYVNKYYHEISDLSEYLSTKDWFCNDKKSSSFLMGYKLEKMLGEDEVSRERLNDFGKGILSELTEGNHDVELSDLILKNYLFLLEKFAPDFVEDFIRSGYKIIDKWVAKEMNATPNMIIFMCHAIKRNLKLDNYAAFFEFSNEPDENYFAYHDFDKVNINTAAVSSNYEKFNDKNVAFLYLFFVLGHELGHAYVMEYKTFTDRNDLKEELLVYNAGISKALHELKTRDFYLEYHDCFPHEFYANLAGLEMMCEQYSRFPSIPEASKEEINRLVANELFYSYPIDSKTGGYMGVVDFAHRFFDEEKGNLLGRKLICLSDNQTELPEELMEVEKNLDDMEKFKLGYHNKYIGILELIANGTAKTTNIIRDLPDLYLKYGHLVEEKYPNYIEKKIDTDEKVY